MEEWKDIYFIENGIEWDYRGLYQVSNKGNIKSLIDNHGQKREKILKIIKSTSGHSFVNLSKNNKKKRSYVHRLVAHMFIDGYFDGADVDHIDTNPLNNHVDNLRWCTRKENCNNELSKKHYSEANKGKPKSEEHKRKISDSVKKYYERVN
jgi:hypothetical protein